MYLAPNSFALTDAGSTFNPSYSPSATTVSLTNPTPVVSGPSVYTVPPTYDPLNPPVLIGGPDNLSVPVTSPTGTAPTSDPLNRLIDLIGSQNGYGSAYAAPLLASPVGPNTGAQDTGIATNVPTLNWTHVLILVGIAAAIWYYVKHRKAA